MEKQLTKTSASVGSLTQAGLVHQETGKHNFSRKKKAGCEAILGGIFCFPCYPAPRHHWERNLPINPRMGNTYFGASPEGFLPDVLHCALHKPPERKNQRVSCCSAELGCVLCCSRCEEILLPAVGTTCTESSQRPICFISQKLCKGGRCC